MIHNYILVTWREKGDGGGQVMRHDQVQAFVEMLCSLSWPVSYKVWWYR